MTRSSTTVVNLSNRLRHRVRVERRVSVRDEETGAIDYRWEVVRLPGGQRLAAVPADVLTGPGRELHAAGTKLAETSARITLRWFPGLLPTMRLVWDGHVYDIVSVEMDRTARQEYRLRCKDGVTDGA